VYSSKNSPISENDKVSPISEYGKTKYEAEKMVLKYSVGAHPLGRSNSNDNDAVDDCL